MTPQDASAYAREICGLAPVIPVIVVKDVAHAVPLAKALVAGGLPVLEVTLRTPAALDVIRAMADVEGGVVGAGTLLTPADVTRREGGRRAVRRLARHHRRAPRRLRGRGAAAARRRRHRLRGDADARARLRRLQVLPRRGQRRRPGAEVLRRPAAADELLPDRRRHDEERARLPRAAERALRRRLLGGGAGPAGRGPLGRGRAPRVREPASSRGDDDRRALDPAPTRPARPRKDTPILARFDRDPDRFGDLLGRARRHAPRLLEDRARRPGARRC